jgi:two-component system chemotaxis response regulator CheB
MANVVVIGASAGGVDPLREIVRSLPSNLPAAVFVVMHVSPLSPSMLPLILNANGGIKAAAAKDGERIEPSRVYVASPDLHMLIEPGRVRLTRGPKENRHRPSIDPLFRTAARVVWPSRDWHCAYRIAGRRGYRTSRHQARGWDFVLPASKIAEKIIELVHEPWTDAEPARAAEITLDLPNAEGEKMKEEEDERWMGKPSAFTCPDCNGTLWEVEDGNLLRFRCRVGHSYSGDGVRAGYNESVEAALWASARSGV